MTKLPSFATFIDLPKEYTITNRSDGYTLVEKPKLIFTTVKEAYLHVKNKLNGEPLFDPKLQLPEGDELMDNMLTLGSESKNGSVEMLMGISEASRIKLLKYHYKLFLKDAEAYKKNPKDFYTAYHFLSSHPAFWHRDFNRPNYWACEDGLASLWMTVLKDKKGKTFFLLEHGMYLDGEIDGKLYTHIVASHDTNLDVVAPTYEKAIIKLAKKVNKYYNLKGEDRVAENKTTIIKAN